MQLAPGTYYFKDRKVFVLVLDGERAGEVATRAEAKAWHAKTLRRMELYARGVSRAARGRHYDRIQNGI